MSGADGNVPDATDLYGPEESAGGGFFFLSFVSIQQKNSKQPTTVVWRCWCKILSILPSCGAEDQARLPLWEGGLGFRSAQRTQPAHWASWADRW